MLVSTALSELIAKSHGNRFSRKGITEIRVDRSIKLADGCKTSCSHNHGYIEKAERFSFLDQLDDLHSLPSYDILEKALNEVKLFENENNVKGCVTWFGYFVESFTTVDLILMKEIFRYRATTLNQYCAELETIYEEVNIPRGLHSLHSKRAKFLEELWHKK